MKLAEKFTTEKQVWTRGYVAAILAADHPRRLSKRETAAKPQPAWDERISKRIDKLIDDAETEDQYRHTRRTVSQGT